MGHLRPRLSILVLALGASACVGFIGSAGSDGKGGPAATGASGSTDGGADAGGAPSLLTAGVRRLTDNEYDNSIADLLGPQATPPSAALAVDTRQNGYTVNFDQRVDGTLGDELQTVAETLAEGAVKNRLSQLVPCAPSAPDCAATFIKTFASRAFRRPATADEIAGLTTVFTTAATGGAFTDGVAAVVSAVLQSASFLYIPLVGAAAAGTSDLGPYEVASALSYLLTASPPDQALLDAAASGALVAADQREAQARRLIASHPRAKDQLVRFVREWLGLDALSSVDHSDSASFVALEPDVQQETAAFVGEVLWNGDGSLRTLLAADFTMASSPLASFYGVSGATGSAFTRVSLAATPRRGLLSQAAFLSGHASKAASSPVKRGVAVLRKLFCHELAPPTGDVAVRAMMPPPPAKTTRERFAAHSTDPVCHACHSQIDPIGFAFEEFDQYVAYRSSENGNPVDASGALAGTDVDGPFQSASDLMTSLSKSEAVRTCFARNVFRFAATQASPELETAFLSLWGAMPVASQDNLIEIIVAFARSDMLVHRVVPQ